MIELVIVNESTDEISELSTDEQNHVAGGPEQGNDPGH